MRIVRSIAAVFFACVTAIVLARIGFAIFVTAWPAYALAAPTKDFTLAMLFARLTLAVVLTVAAACVATLTARDDGRIGWWVGGFFVLVSLPSHLHTSWNDYPVWYHFVYLAGLVPVAGFSARALRGRWPAAIDESAIG